MPSRAPVPDAVGPQAEVVKIVGYVVETEGELVVCDVSSPSPHSAWPMEHALNSHPHCGPCINPKPATRTIPLGTCEACGGSGETFVKREGWSCGCGRGVAHFVDCGRPVPYDKVPCPTCKGSGTTPPPALVYGIEPGVYDAHKRPAAEGAYQNEFCLTKRQEVTP